MHAILGGGDQLYNDNLWALPQLDSWLKKPRAERLKYQPTVEETTAVEDYYRTSYLSHIHHHPAAELLRSLPQVCSAFPNDASRHDDEQPSISACVLWFAVDTWVILSVVSVCGSDASVILTSAGSVRTNWLQTLVNTRQGRAALSRGRVADGGYLGSNTRMW